MIFFEQLFPQGASGTSLHTNQEVISSFPTLRVADSLHFATFQGLWDLGTIGQSGRLYHFLK